MGCEPVYQKNEFVIVNKISFKRLVDEKNEAKQLSFNF